MISVVLILPWMGHPNEKLTFFWHIRLPQILEDIIVNMHSIAFVNLHVKHL